MTRCFAILFLAIGAYTASAQTAQPLPDAAALYKQAAEALQKVHSLQYVVETTLLGGPMATPKTQVAVAISNPGKLRTQTTAMGFTVLLVSDGESTWFYQSMSKEYVKVPAALGIAGALSSTGLSTILPNVSQAQMSQKVLRDESLDMEGVTHACWVVETHIAELTLPVAPGAKMTDVAVTTCFDKKLGLDLRSDASLTMSAGLLPNPLPMKIAILKTHLKVDEPIPDSVFTFTPPEDSKLVEKMSFGATPFLKTDLVGRAAPAFELKSAEGKAYSAASLKGAPVLLDFWATWCAPCRQNAPAIDRLATEFKGKLAVLSVSPEDAATIAAYRKKTPMAATALAAGDSDILSTYGVQAFPTFVLIGADGNVLAVEAGFTDETGLRALLAKAGLKAAK